LTAFPTAAPDFVSFHADRPAGAAAVHPNANLAAQGYMRMLDLLFRSARLFHRGARCTLLTDASTHVHGIRGTVQRVLAPIDHRTLMLSRSLAQLQHVEQTDFRRPLVLIDSDILLRASLQDLFSTDFDVGLTWRTNREMPINGGLIVLNNRRPEVTRRFFGKFVAIYQERYAGDSNAAWYGDQLAMRDCVGLGHETMAKEPVQVIDGVRVRFLPCDTYNFSPDNSLAAIASGLPDKRVLHFKGQRKRLMQPFWDAFLQSEESHLPWARWLGRRAVARLERDAAAETVEVTSPARKVPAP